MAVDLSVYKQPTLADYLRRDAESAFEQRLKLRQVAALEGRAKTGGNTPAAIQIVNEMELAARAAQDASLPPEARAKGKARYQWLNQVSKSYGIDRGMEAAIPDLGLGDMGQPGMGAAQPPALPGTDPQDEFAQALQQLGQEGQLSPQTGEMPQFSGVGELPGFSATQSRMKARVKGAEQDAANASDREWKPGTARATQQAQKDVDLVMDPQIAEASARQGVIGRNEGEVRGNYDDFMSGAAGLKDAANQLYKLADASTYTLTGKARDAFIRQFGFDPGNAAAARAASETIISVMVLPLLRPTFGAQFTKAEGDWMRQTLGDANLSGREKQAQIRARMQGWQRQAEQLSSRLGEPAPGKMFEIDQPAPPRSVKSPGEIEFTLKRKGFSDAEIREYMRGQ